MTQQILLFCFYAAYAFIYLHFCIKSNYFDYLQTFNPFRSYVVPRPTL
jgi:hypothetical protein